MTNFADDCDVNLRARSFWVCLETREQNMGRIHVNGSMHCQNTMPDSRISEQRPRLSTDIRQLMAATDNSSHQRRCARALDFRPATWNVTSKWTERLQGLRLNRMVPLVKGNEMATTSQYSKTSPEQGNHEFASSSCSVPPRQSNVHHARQFCQHGGGAGSLK